MAYAEVSDVKARAGALATAWGETTAVTIADLELFLDQAAQEMDAALVSLGLGAPATDPKALAGLRSLNAAGALMRALPATWPSGSGAAAIGELLAEVKLEWFAVMQTPDTFRTFPAVAMLLAGGQEGSLGASSFWSTDPMYPTWGDITEARLMPSTRAPGFARGQKF